MFAENLKKARLTAGLSQGQVASKIYKSQQAYAKYELGKSSPDPETIVAIAKALNTSTQFLLGEEKATKRLQYKLAKPRLKSVKINDEAMEPLIHANDIVVCKPQRQYKSGDTIAFTTGDINSSVQCRTIKEINENKITLTAHNKKYSTMLYTNRKDKEKQIDIIGKVIEARTLVK